MKYELTSYQTVGPYFRIGLEPLYRADLTSPSVKGKIITIRGKIVDGEGNSVPDAIMEIWQADSQGKYSTETDRMNNFTGFGRCAVTEEGFFQFTTIMPGPVPHPSGSMQAPHIAVSLLMRGLLNRLVTRIYFEGQENSGDHILSQLSEDRRRTLVATKQIEEENTYQFCIILQGEQETVFFDL